MIKIILMSVYLSTDYDHACPAKSIYIKLFVSHLVNHSVIFCLSSGGQTIFRFPRVVQDQILYIRTETESEHGRNF